MNAALNDNQSGNGLKANMGPIETGAYKKVELEFLFSASGLSTFNTYLKWKN